MKKFITVYLFNICLGLIVGYVTGHNFVEIIAEYHPLLWFPMAIIALHVYWLFGVVGYLALLVLIPVNIQFTLKETLWSLLFYSPMIGLISILIYLKKGKPHPRLIKLTPYLVTAIINITLILSANVAVTW